MRRPVISLLVLLAPAAVAAPPRDDVAALIPDRADFVLLIPSGAELSKAAVQFAHAAGLKGMHDVTPDEFLDKVVESLDRELPGLDRSGAVALILSHNDDAAIIYSCAQPAVFENEHKFRKGADGVYAPVGGGEGYFVGVKGGVAVSSESDEVVSNVLRGGREFGEWLTALPAQYRDHVQLLVRIRIPPWRAKVEGSLVWAERLMVSGIAQSGRSGEAGIGFWRWAMSQARNLIGEMETYTAVLAIEPDALRLRDRIEFRKDSATAEYLKNVRPSEKPILRGLPDLPGTIAYYGGEWQTSRSEGMLFANFVKSMLEQIAQDTKIERETLDQVSKITIESFRHVSGQNGLITMDPDGNGLIFAGTYFSRQPKEFIEGSRKAQELSPQLFGAMVSGGNLVAASHTETIDGHEVLACTTDFNGNDPQLERMLRAVYGPKMTVMLSALPYGVATALGNGERVSKVISAQLLRREDEKLPARVEAAMREIPAQPQIVAMLDVPAGARAALSIANSMGVPVPELPAIGEQPYCVFGFYMEAETMRSEVFIPAAPIRALNEVAEKAPRQAR